MNAIVLVGHGTLPEALRASVEMIVGKRDDVFCVGLDPDDGEEQLEAKLAAVDEEIGACESKRVLADLLGGSPCNAALRRYAGDADVSLVSGMNLAMVIAAVIEGAGAEDIVAEGHVAIHDVKAFMEGTERPFGAIPAAKAPAAKPRREGPQEIVGVRVDSRGIHGQVATVWTPYYKVDRIVVVDAKTVRDETQKMALKLAKPANVKLSILSPERAAERLAKADSYPGERLFVVMPRVETLKALDELGCRFDEVVLGNVPNRPGTRTYVNCVNLTDPEAAIVRELVRKRTYFTARQVPSEAGVDFNEIITGR